MRLLGAAILALCVCAGSGDPPAPGADPPRRVLVRVGRNLSVRGLLVRETPDEVAVETLDGAVETFSKARVLSVIHLVDPKPGQRGVVLLRDGRRHGGVILEDAWQHVIIEIDGVRTTLPRDIVDRVILEPTFEQRYQRYREAAGTARERLGLCRWLVEQRRYELARKELVELIEASPSPEARQLLRLVKAQLALDRPAGPGGGGDLLGEALVGRLLTPEEVNLIRVYELEFHRPPRVAVDAATIRTMIELYGASPAIPASQPERRALYREDPIEIVELLFQLRARELYSRIEVLTEPYALNIFRQRVHNGWLLNSCATAQCHGGLDAGRFFLHRRRYKDERVRYTNLLILERLEIDPEWPLIDYDEPMRSLIIQYGLPRTEARRPHPDVRGWRPVFGVGSQRMIDDTVEWIESMMKPRPEYPVEYEPPVPGGSPDAEPAGTFPDLDDGRAPR